MANRYHLICIIFLIYLDNSSFMVRGEVDKALDVSSVCKVNIPRHKAYTIGLEDTDTFVIWKGDPLRWCNVYFIPSSRYLKICSSIVENRLRNANAHVLITKRVNGFSFVLKTITSDDSADVPYCGQSGYALGLQIATKSLFRSNNSLVLKFYAEEIEQGTYVIVVTAVLCSLFAFIAITCSVLYKGDDKEDDIESDSYVITSISQTIDSQKEEDTASVHAPTPQ